MSFEATRQAIEARMAASWGTTPIRFENVPFPETVAPYIALFILDGEGNQITVGDPVVKRWTGLILIQVFVPQDTGTALARSYADSLGAIFERQTFSAGSSGTIRGRIASIQSVGVKNGWYQINVTVPFIRDKQT